MDAREELNQQCAQELMNLANDVLADFGDGVRLFKYTDPYMNPAFKKIKKLERKFKKRYKEIVNTDVCGELDDFCIELKYIPSNLHYLMRVIGWLDSSTYSPSKHIDGFYSSSYHDYTARDVTTKIWHYITVGRYIELLFIDNEMQIMYGRQNKVA